MSTGMATVQFGSRAEETTLKRLLFPPQGHLRDHPYRELLSYFLPTVNKTFYLSNPYSLTNFLGQECVDHTDLSMSQWFL